MLHKLEKHADNLENIVQQRTAELKEEKHKTDMLLCRMLPPYAFNTNYLIAYVDVLYHNERCKVKSQV